MLFTTPKNSQSEEKAVGIYKDISIKKQIANAFALKMYAQGAAEIDITNSFCCHWIRKDLRYPDKSIWVLTPIDPKKTTRFSEITIDFDVTGLDISFDYFFLDQRANRVSVDILLLSRKRDKLDTVAEFTAKSLETYEKRLFFFLKHKLAQTIAQKRTLVARILMSKERKANTEDALRAALRDNKNTLISLTGILDSLKQKNNDYLKIMGKDSLQWKHPLYDIPLRSCYVLERRNGRIILSKVKYETIDSFVLENDYFHPTAVKKDGGNVVMFLRLIRPYLSIDKNGGNSINIEELDFIEMGF